MNLKIEFSPWVWGFTKSSENWNGRIAMLGFLLTLIVEATSGKGVLHFIGIV